MSDADKTVFISYRRSASSFIARAVFMDLRAHGYDVFMDVETINSGVFDRIILNQIAARAHFVVILTPGSIERYDEPGDWMRREIEEAIRLKRNIVPLLVNGFMFNPETEKYLIGRLNELPRFNALPVYHEYFDEAMTRLRSRFLTQQAYGALTPTPDTDQSTIMRRIERVSNQPAPEHQELHAEKFYDLACEKWGQGDWEGVIADMSTALQLNPDYVDAYSGRSGAKISVGDFAGALADASQAIQLNPTYASAYRNRGLAYLGLDDVEAAIADFTESIRLRPAYAPAYFNRGSAWYQKADYDQAIEDFREAIRLDPKDANPYACLGDCYYQLGRYDEALQTYEQCLELPDSHEDRRTVQLRVQELKRKLVK